MLFHHARFPFHSVPLQTIGVIKLPPYVFLDGLAVALRGIKGIRGGVVSLVKARHAVTIRVAGVDHPVEGGFIHAFRPFT